MRDADFDLHGLYLALEARKTERGLSWREVALEVRGAARRMSPSTLTGFASRAVVEGDGVLQALRWLGRTPESFMPDVADADANRYRLPPAKGKVLRFDTLKLHAALEAARSGQELSWDEVARRIPGAGGAALRALGARQGRVAFPLVGRIARWLDQPVASFVRTADW